MSISVQLGWLCSTGPTGRQHGPAVRSCSCQCHNPATKRLLFPITLVSGSPWLRICSPLCPAPWMSAQAKTSTARLRPSFAWGRLCSFRPLGPSQYKGLSQELSGRYFLQLWLQSHSNLPPAYLSITDIGGMHYRFTKCLRDELPGNGLCHMGSLNLFLSWYGFTLHCGSEYKS